MTFTEFKVSLRSYEETESMYSVDSEHRTIQLKNQFKKGKTNPRYESELNNLTTQEV